ncbi:hypothetical protein [uncultured Umboniibacter sp.]|nr:hypothetical protein [uncultured Umboniibacter sp.]
MAIIHLDELIPLVTFLKVLSATLSENLTDISNKMLSEPLNEMLNEEMT